MGEEEFTPFYLALFMRYFGSIDTTTTLQVIHSKHFQSFLIACSQNHERSRDTLPLLPLGLSAENVGFT